MNGTRTREFHIRERVRFRPGAIITKSAAACGRGVVDGYDEANGEDFVIVRVRPEGMAAFDQWVLPNEIEPEAKGDVA